MKAEILAFGDELTSGQRVDTNSAWLSDRLGRLGITTLAHTTAGDDISMSVAVIRQAAARADLILCTGGLGPTEDDVVREAIAAAMNVSLEENLQALRHIEGLFARRARPMPDRNRVQALFPRGSRQIENPEGTAPGIAARIPPRNIPLYSFPGVPAEMKQMWPTVEAELAASCELPGVIHHHVLKCFGFGESHLAEMLPGILDRGRNPLVGITAHEATISLRIAARGSDEAQARELAEQTVKEIRGRLGNAIFSERDEEELNDVVLRALANRHWTLATAELETRGEIARRLATSGFADSYRGGTVGATGLIIKLASTDRRSTPPADIPATHHTAWHVARALRTDFQADIGMAFLELAKDGASPSVVDSSELYGVISGPNGDLPMTHRWGGHSSVVRIRAAKEAMNHLRFYLDRTPE